MSKPTPPSPQPQVPVEPKVNKKTGLPPPPALVVRAHPAPDPNLANPELTGSPTRIPPGPVMSPHVPAPVAPGLPPGSPPPTTAVEAPPATQGSLTPAQVKLAQRGNPALRAAELGAEEDNASPEATALQEAEVNDDGFVAGGDVSDEQHRAFRLKQRNEARAAAAKKASK
jgi:hypothetical protein